jgi:hypothetical protein
VPINQAREISMKSDKRSGDTTMRELVAAVAGPRSWGENRKSWLSRAARSAGVTFRQAKALFYGEITDPEHKAARRMKEAAARHEAKQLAGQFEGLAVSLNQRDADFHSADIAALLSAARVLRGLDRTGDDGSLGGSA